MTQSVTNESLPGNLQSQLGERGVLPAVFAEFGVDLSCSVGTACLGKQRETKMSCELLE